jgi:polysaccharide chain length determinant protein (PEP-CTERM system associated)
MKVGQYGYKDYINMVMRRKGVFLSIALGVMTIAMIASFLMPKVYRAESTVFIEQSVISDLVKGIAVTPSMESKVRVLRVSMLSRNMLLDVMRKLDTDVEVANSAQREAYIKSLQNRTNIDIRAKDGVFFVSFRDSSPEFARDYVNMLTQTYIEKNTASKREESLEATRFLAEQIETFKKRINSVEREIDEYKSEHGLVLALNEGSLRRAIDQAEKKLEETELRRMELEARRRSMVSLSPRRQRVTRLENTLEGMLATYTNNHPEVTRVRNQLEALRSGSAAQEEVNEGNRESLEMVQVQLEANRRLRDQQRAIIEENKELLKQIPATRSGLTDLIRKKENEQQIYSQLVSRFGQSEVSKQMEMENKSVSFRIIDPAILPKTPVSPDRPRIIISGLVGGLALAFGLIFLLDLLKNAIKNPGELKQVNLPVLGIIPRITKPETEKRRRRRDLSIYLAAGAYAAVLMSVTLSEVMGLNFVEEHIGVHLRNLYSQVMDVGGVRDLFNRITS